MDAERRLIQVDTTRIPRETREVDSRATHEAMFATLERYTPNAVALNDRLSTDLSPTPLVLRAPDGASRRNHERDAWEWSDGRVLIVTAFRPLFPDRIDAPTPASRAIAIGEHLLQLDLSEDFDHWWAIVRGYLGDETQLLLQIGARSEVDRDSLLAAVQTLGSR